MTDKWLNDRYELLEKIGEGGMAEVYKAKDHKLNRFNAIKILRKSFAEDSVFVNRFKREAEDVANLSHSNIISVVDVGNEDDINYIVMEYVKGKNLKEVIIENKKLEIDKVVDYGIQIAKALEYAHIKEVIHRDIKPQNILVSDNGDVKVTDFGIAKTATSATISQTGKVMGSAHYISPEQAKGVSVDSRTDIYSFGIVLYEMITGSVPFNAETPVTIAIKQIQERPMPPILLDKNIPESLNNLILKCIAKEADDRYQSFSDVLRDLRSIRNDKNIIIPIGSESEDKTMILKNPDDPNSSKNGNKTKIEEEDVPKKSSKLKTVLIVLTLLIFSVTAAIIASLYIMDKPTDKVVLAELIGKSQEEAESILTQQELKADVKYIKSSKPSGEVIETSPKAGVKLAKGSPVTLKVSEAKKIKIENYTGQKFDEAKKAIEDLGLKVNKEEEFNEEIETGTVISQNPEDTSTELNEGDTVKLVVSKGKELVNVTVPDFTGMSPTDASASIEQNNLTVGSIYETKSADEKAYENNGKVYLQSVEPGTEVAKGSKVSLYYYVYTGNESDRIKLPSTNFVGMSQGDVESAFYSLNGANFVIKVYEGTTSSSIVESIKVNGQQYVPGASIPANSEILIESAAATGANNVQNNNSSSNGNNNQGNSDNQNQQNPDNQNQGNTDNQNQQNTNNQNPGNTNNQNQQNPDVQNQENNTNID